MLVIFFIKLVFLPAIRAREIIAVYDETKNRIWKFKYNPDLESGKQILNSTIFYEEEYANFNEYFMEGDPGELFLDYKDLIKINKPEFNCFTFQETFLKEVGKYGFLIDESYEEELNFKKRDNSTIDEKEGKPIHCLIKNKGKCKEIINFYGIECLRVDDSSDENVYYYYQEIIQNNSQFGMNKELPEYNGLPKFSKSSKTNYTLIFFISFLVLVLILTILILWRKYRANQKFIEFLDEKE
jgi:hypothetical protein